MSSSSSTRIGSGGTAPRLKPAPLLARSSTSPLASLAATARSPRSPRTASLSRHAVVAERATASTVTEYLIAVTALVALLLAADAFVATETPALAAAIAPSALKHGLRQCQQQHQQHQLHQLQHQLLQPPPQRRTNPRFSALLKNNASLLSQAHESPARHNPLLIKNALLWDGIGNRREGVDVATANGIIIRVGEALTTKDLIDAARLFDPETALQEHDVEVWDISGRVLSPGLVDMHSHVGTSSVPGFSADSDTNEETESRTVPQLRILDSFNAQDTAIDLIASGGVTTSLVLPGSGAIMGGEGIAIKMARTTRNSADEMLLNYGNAPEDASWRWMKMACGENPKNWGDGYSRMGSGWEMRAKLEEARDLMKSQDDWCQNANRLDTQFKSEAHLHIPSRYPEDLKLESLVALLQGQVKLQVHCYQVNDIDMMIRNSQEFNFTITALHHATESHLLATKLATTQIAVALFADHSLYKREAYHHSVLAGQILHRAGVPVAYKSDHPVTNAQHLLYEAQKAAYYGVDEDVAFMGVTSVPAERVGAAGRIGRVEVGWDADLVVWDREPMVLGARPLRVVVDGFVVLERPMVVAPVGRVVVGPVVTPDLGGKRVLEAYTIGNISTLYASETSVFVNTKVTVEQGIVTCVGEKCKDKGVVLDLQGGVVIPGMIAAGVPVGLQEIGQERSTWDGVAGTREALEGNVWAKDG
ncbi:hypothetical protein HDU98_003505, partial [Podochytrium sp. JEL0797]